MNSTTNVGETTASTLGNKDRALAARTIAAHQKGGKFSALPLPDCLAV